MGRNKNKKKSKVYPIGVDNVDEKIKYVMPVDEFDLQFLQLNYNKCRVRNNDHVVPVWSVQGNTFDNSYYEFEIVAGSDKNGVSDASCEMPIEVFKDNANINTVKKLNKTDDEIDFTTYLKLVNVFKESDTAIAGSATDQKSLIDNVVIVQEPSVKVIDYNKTVESKTVNTDPLVTLCVTSGEKLKVAMSNFHGFWTSGDSVQCRVCLVMVEDVEAHKMEIRHMKRIASTINNMHCVRKIGPILNHCMLCNEIVENIEFHLKTNEAHTKHLEKALKLYDPEILNTNAILHKNHTNQIVVSDSIIQKARSPTDIAHCKVCDRQMHINTLKSHNIGKYHKAMLDKNTLDPLGKLRFEDQQQFNSNVQIKHTDTNIETKTTSETTYPEKLKYLMIDAAHTKQLVYMNALKLISKYQTSAKVRTVSVGNTVKKDLVSMPKMTNTSANQPKNNLGLIAVDKSVIQMVKYPINICIKKAETSQESMLPNHLIVAIDKCSVVNIGSSNCTANEGTKKSFCKICNRHMQSVQFKVHIEGKHHKAQLLRIKNKEIKEVAKNFHLPSVSDIKIKSANQYRPTENSVSDKTDFQNLKILNVKEVRNIEENCTDNKPTIDNDECILTSNESHNAAHSKFCGKKIHFSNINSYEKGECHKAMLDNKTKSEESARDTRVKAAMKYEIGPTSIPTGFHHKFQKNLQRELFNCNGDRYDDVLLNSLIRTFSEPGPSNTKQQKFNDNTLKKADTISAVNAKTKTMSNTANTEKLKYFMTDIRNDYFFNCKVCQVSVPKTDKHLLDHVNGARHFKEYTFLLKQNKIKIKNENLLYCEACKVFMCVATELVHIEMETHKNIIAAEVKGKNVVKDKLRTDIKNEMGDPGTNVNMENVITVPRTLNVASSKNNSVQHGKTKTKADPKICDKNASFFNIRNNTENAMEGETSGKVIEHSSCNKVNRLAIKSNRVNNKFLVHCFKCNTIVDLSKTWEYFIEEIFNKHGKTVVEDDSVHCCYCCYCYCYC